MTYQEALSKGISLLESENIADARLDAWYLLSYVTEMSRASYIMEAASPIDDLALYKYQSLLYRRAKHEPLQYIVGEQDFMGLKFWVNEHVLIPRQDTELLVEQALAAVLPGSHILDLCTGSGCVLISLVALGQGLSGTGVDISKEAIDVAKENGQRLVGNKAVFYRGDLFAPVHGKFNAIVSNPPYIPTAVIEGLEPEVKDHEPRLALDGTDDGLYFYRKICAQAADYLNEGGWLLVEIGYDQGQAVAGLFQAAGFKDVQIVKDLSKNDRVVKGHL